MVPFFEAESVGDEKWVGFAAASTGTSYEFDFNLAGTTTSLLKLTSVVLTAGHTYTIYLAGPGSSLRGIVSQDN